MEVINAGGYTYCNLRNKYGTINNEQVSIYANCLSNDSEILTEKGMKKLKDIEIGKSFIIFSFDFSKQILEKDVAKRVNSGIKEVYEVETKFGKKIKASKDHIFFVSKNNKIIQRKLEELKEGDEILCL